VHRLLPNPFYDGRRFGGSSELANSRAADRRPCLTKRTRFVIDIRFCNRRNRMTANHAISSDCQALVAFIGHTVRQDQ
jgi:hypothetical protein